MFFTNLLPGITFASDLYVLTGANWGTIEVVFSTGLCGIIFAMWVISFIMAFVPLAGRLSLLWISPKRTFPYQAASKSWDLSVT